MKVRRHEALQSTGELLYLRHGVNMTLDHSNFYWDRSELEDLWYKVLGVKTKRKKKERKKKRKRAGRTKEMEHCLTNEYVKQATKDKKEKVG